MGEQRSKLEYFWAELRRRHVVRVAVAYAVVAFVVLQLSEIILPAFSAEWALQLVVVFTTLGFPLVVALAWVFDLTPQGVQVTADADDTSEVPLTGVLPRLALLTVTLLAVVGLGSWWVGKGIEAPTATAAGGVPAVLPAAYDPDEPIRSLAVLPLQNFSENDGQDYFVAGMHEALIERLSRLPAIRVVSRTSVSRYALSDKTIPEIARELNAEGIVEGSVLRAGDEVRITVQLIHGASDTHVWSQTYDRNFSDVLALQSEVAEAIAREIQGELTPDQRATMLSFAPASDVPSANDEFMKARYEQSRQTAEGLQAAIDHYSHALEADPSFAGAYAGLAGTEVMMGLSGSPNPTPSLLRARMIALKALEVDPEHPEALDILMLIDEQFGRDMEDLTIPADPVELPHEVRIVRHTSPGSAELETSEMVITLESDVATEVGAFMSDATGTFETATDLGKQLRAVWAGWSTEGGQGVSVAPALKIQAAQQLRLAGRTQEAIRLLEEVCMESPDHLEVWEALELLYASEGDYDELLEMRRMWVDLADGDEASVDRLEDRLAREGPDGYWEWRLEELQSRSSEAGAVSPVYMAAAHAAMGEVDQAFTLLQDAAARRDRRLRSLRTDPVWDALRSDPRFVSLLREMRGGRPRPVRRPPIR